MNEWNNEIVKNNKPLIPPRKNGAGSCKRGICAILWRWLPAALFRPAPGLRCTAGNRHPGTICPRWWVWDTVGVTYPICHWHNVAGAWSFCSFDLPLPWGLFLASGSPIIWTRINWAGRIQSRAHVCFFPFPSAPLRVRKKTEQARSAGRRCANARNSSAGRPLTFPPGDQYIWWKIGGERTSKKWKNDGWIEISV